jgi:hypothetical protein
MALLSCLTVVACGPSLVVTSDYDRTVDFGKFRTFSIYHSGSQSQTISSLNEGRIINAIKAEMTRKGYMEVDVNPDLLVNAVAVVKDRVGMNARTDYYANGGLYRPYFGMNGTMYSYTSYTLSHYKDGSLIIDVIDARSNRTVWQGAGNSRIDGPIRDPATSIPRAIAKIMEKLPSTPASN